MKKLFLLLLSVMAVTLAASAQLRTVTGLVLDALNDEPILGATVMPVGGGEGTSTDIDGKFILHIPFNVKELTVSYVGMKTKTVPVKDNMTISLESGEEVLETVVVTGYGSSKKLGSVVGSVAVVSAEAFETVPTPTFVDALQGQVAGLTIFSNSGDPSSINNSIRLRGVNSINADNTPLFILDGAPVSESVFTTLSPNDIESITVLKDAASTAIYGSRAANGVIVITSKRGRYGENSQFSLRATYGWSEMVPDNLHVMNSRQYIDFRDLINQPVEQEVKDLVDKYGLSTTWRDETFDSHAPTYQIEGTLSGGGANSSYYLSVNHMKQEGIIAQSGMQRDIVRASFRSRVTDFLSMGFQSNLGYTKYETNSEASSSSIYLTDPMVFSRMALPYDTPYYYTTENGSIEKLGRADYLKYSGIFTPKYIQSTRKIPRTRATVNLGIWEQINPVKGLTLRAQQSMDAYDQRNKGISYPLEGLEVPGLDDPIYLGTPDPDTGIIVGSNSQGFSRYYSFTYTNTAEYTNTINDVHEFTVLVGQESIISKATSFGVYTEGQTDRRMMLLTQGTEITMNSVSESIVEQVLNSYFLKFNYSYDDKYFLDGTIRRDGSSQFAPKHRWGTFFSIGAMWHMKAESFMQPLTWLDDARLRVSYGTTGNANIGNYAYFGLVGTGGMYHGVKSWGLAQMSKPDLTWESVRALDCGLNMRLVNRVTADLNFYRKETVDMILPIPYSYTTGFSSGDGNIGNMTNTGVDVDVRLDVVSTPDWYFGLRGNFNYNRNRITKLFDGQDELTLIDRGLQYKVGHNAGEFYCVPYLGVDPLDGKQMWLDINNNVTKIYNAERDSRLVGKSMYSPWSGGWGFDFRWKNISLRTDWAWAAGKYMTNNDRYFVENSNFATSYNQMTSMLDIWTHPGQVTNIPAYGETIQFDTHLLENASFMRLKNVTLSYSFPKSWLSKALMQNASIYFTGRNLLTFTGYTGYDPEPETNVVAFWYPNTRQYEVGIDITF